MPGARRLWTGPHGAALRDRALADSPTDPSGLWLVPSRPARDPLIALLGRKRQVAIGLRVWCWDDLWRSIGDERADAPARLSAVGARAALGEAIAGARRDGIIPTIADAISFAGFRRRLQARIATWTRAERHADGPSPDDDPRIAEPWRIFSRYRAVLKRLGAEDAEGFAVWASRTLQQTPPPQWKRLGPVTVLDLANPSLAHWRALESFHARAKAMRVTLAYEGIPELAEVYAEAAPIRERLLGWGFAEVRVEPELWRPSGLLGIERELFRSDAHSRPELERGDGLTILGAPQGEGVGRVVARHVRQLLDRGESPDDILVLFRHWDDDAALVLETMQAWGLPIVADSKRSLATEPAVSALRLAMNLPVVGWETARLVQLLRNSQVRPGWPEARPPLALASAASALHATRVFRGLDSIRAALDRPLADDPKDRPAAERARIARPLLERMVGSIEAVARPGRWDELVARLQGLAEALRLGSTDDDALDHLWNALDDHGAVPDRLRQGDRSFTWPAFAREVEGLVRDLEVPAPQISARGPAVRLTTVDSAGGLRANHVILANLGEGTFPTRESVDPSSNPLPPGEGARRAGEGPPIGDGQSPDDLRPTIGTPEPSAEAGPPNLAFAREMALFLRVVGAADAGLVLAYPTTDSKGQELLSAGFLDDVLRLFPDRLHESFHEVYRRFDPALAGWPDLAGSPADARVRAVALACEDGRIGDLIALTRSEVHRPPLEGTAAALRVAHARFARKSFGSYDGLLRDPGAIRRIGREFGPEHRFSASQLESFVFCPFQFFLRYALALVPLDDRTELQDDYGERGSKIHRILEELHVLNAQEAGCEGQTLDDLVPIVIGNELRSDRSRSSELDVGLKEIERRRLERVVHRYARQHRAYEDVPQERPQPLRLEVEFGQPEDDSRPSLELGGGAVRLQGKIDRIDLVHALEGTAFRVIDYKTGACPSKKSVHQALYLQLPLYALAVERLGLADAGTTLHDVGYWSVGADGYKSIELKDWEQSGQRLESFVLEVVDQLREGVFAVDPKKEDCTRSCDYRAVCRIAQIRSSGKRRDHVPSLDLDA